jgi:hypothetical protein
MRNETRAWLSVLEDAARDRHIETEPLRDQAFPQADASPPVHDLFVKHIRESDSEVRSVELDYVRYGQLLREALGWENSYPAVPPFPESQPGTTST